MAPRTSDAGRRASNVGRRTSNVERRASGVGRRRAASARTARQTRIRSCRPRREACGAARGRAPPPKTSSTAWPGGTGQELRTSSRRRARESC
ncbi:hypothetical protein FLW53_11670 [Microbispora sp. SCL1-1]|nr:hypothetical protein FLW53_11670 [Microbispora sp. SCL1-1]